MNAYMMVAAIETIANVKLASNILELLCPSERQTSVNRRDGSECKLEIGV